MLGGYKSTKSEDCAYTALTQTSSSSLTTMSLSSSSSHHHHIRVTAVSSRTCRTDDDKAEISRTWCERNKCYTV